MAEDADIMVCLFRSNGQPPSDLVHINHYFSNIKRAHMDRGTAQTADSRPTEIQQVVQEPDL